ncbi:MAG: HAMP domain-containing sensor histidine kinase [Bacteroidales bacterium]
MNIRYKLSFQFSLIVLTILLIFSTSIYYFSESYREYDYYSRLKDRANTTARLLFDVEEVDKSLLKIIDRNTQALTNEKITVIDQNYKIIYSSTDDTLKVSLSLADDIKNKKIVKTTNEDHDVLGLLYEKDDNQFMVIASAYDLYGVAKMKNLKIILIIGFLITLLITVFAGIIFSGKALAPISNVVAQVNKITISNLNSRLDEGNRQDEIAKLAMTFNSMLQRLEEAFIFQRDFVSSAAHELRTPFSVILVELDYCLLQQRSKEHYIQTLKNLQVEIKKLNKLSNSLLELARISYDNSKFELKTFRLDELVIETCNNIMNSNKECKTNILFKNLPEDSNFLTISGNEHLLEIAIKNLIENAFKFSNYQSVDVVFSVNNKTISIQITDKGIGISKEDMKIIFQPFFRGKNTQFIAGYGLGLALTQKIIHLHNGTISVDSEVGKGSAFTISFPNRSVSHGLLNNLQELAKPFKMQDNTLK